MDERTVLRTAREIARAEMTERIVGHALGQLSVVGAGGLSLRAIARDLGVSSSAIYRYFGSRDELLTALLVHVYGDLGSVLESCVADSVGQPSVARFSALCHTLRGWAAEQPEGWALLYGSPVPGYVAPADTVGPAGRVTGAFLAVLGEDLHTSQSQAPGGAAGMPSAAAVASGAKGSGSAADAVDKETGAEEGAQSPARDAAGMAGDGRTGAAVRAPSGEVVGGHHRSVADGGDMAGVPETRCPVEGLAAGGGWGLPSAAAVASVEAVRVAAGGAVDGAVVLRAMGAWSLVMGAVSLELFGHLVGGVSDVDAYFGEVVRQAQRVLAPPA